MKAISSATSAALSARVTKPVYLVEIDFSPVSRLSSNGDIMWQGNLWSGGTPLVVSGISADGSGNQSGQIQVGNLDSFFGALTLDQGVADRAVRIWAGDRSALEDEDMSLVFSGVIESAEVTDTHVSFQIAAEGSRTRFMPSRFISKAAGFNHLIPSGKRLKVGSNVYVLERPPK